MKITYLGHSSFIINCDGVRIVTDPFNSFVGYEMPVTNADIVTCSHFHEDHHDLSRVCGNYLLLDGKCSYAAKGLQIDSFPGYHDNANGTKRGANLIFQIVYKGIKLVHMGDIGEEPDFFSLSLTNIDFLFIPIGGFYTIDPLTAYKYIEKLKPKHIVPMHYRLDETKFGLARIEEFTTFFKASEILIVKDAETSDILMTPNKRIIVFERFRAL